MWLALVCSIAAQAPPAEAPPPAPAEAAPAQQGPAEKAPLVRKLPTDASVAVMQFVAKSGADPDKVAAIEDVVGNTVRAAGQKKVITTRDVQAILGQEAVKQQMECSAASCLSDLADALGAEFLISGDVARFGDSTLLTLRLIDMKNAAVIASASRKVDGTEDTVLDVAPSATSELIGTAEQSSGLVTVKVEPEIGFLDIAPWASAGVCALTGIGSGVFLGLTVLDLSAMDATTKGNADWQTLRGSAFVKSVVADSLGGVAVLAGATTAGLLVVSALSGNDDEPAPASAATSAR